MWITLSLNRNDLNLRDNDRITFLRQLWREMIPRRMLLEQQ